MGFAYTVTDRTFQMFLRMISRAIMDTMLRICWSVYHFSNQQFHMVTHLSLVFCLFYNQQGAFQRILPYSHMTQSNFWIPTISHHATILLLSLPSLYLRDLMTHWWQTCWRCALEKEQSSVDMIPWPLGALQWETQHWGPTVTIRPEWQPWNQVQSETRSISVRSFIVFYCDMFVSSSFVLMLKGNFTMHLYSYLFLSLSK